MPPMGVGLQISTLREGPPHPDVLPRPPPCVAAGGGDGEGGGGGGGGAGGAPCAQTGRTWVKATANENATARNFFITASVAGQCLF
jgi:hypothetical protein